MTAHRECKARSAHWGGHWTALASQVRMRQSSPSSGLVQAPVAHLQPLKSPSQTTAYANLYLSDVGHTCGDMLKFSVTGRTESSLWLRRSWMPQSSSCTHPGCNLMSAITTAVMACK